MATSKEEIRNWLESAREAGCYTHVIVACDTFNYEDYPVNVRRGEDPQQEAHKYMGNMQTVMEVYALHLDLEAQLAEHRAWHYEQAPPQIPEPGTVYDRLLNKDDF